ncbi:MupA/Atu3671 family FMN-dependent luciferase-like monooxygenase [Streptomyces sp. NPDC050610]|uniref:MupA/Atu3671 family FMN-dependent luciferase-like monooxygenase n=1 Tax=Streptomyces sp. NPDC050610 TaxID=3157097 RepID=UPI003423BA88
MDLSLFYFANDSTEPGDKGRYELLLEGAKFADEHGFSAVWTPERHFHPFGGMYPNPSVLGAAVASVTERVAIRAGSVVAPLHHPARIAEEWSVVDNLSGGRVGVAFASGWNSVDFALRPDVYDERKRIVSDRVGEVRTLWQGGSVPGTDGLGRSVDVRAFPPPVQRELPVWLTSGGSVETFQEAGRLKAGVLTHLLVQDLDILAEKIREYRRVAAAEHDGWPGHVALMVHTLVGEDVAAVKEQARQPLTEYLKSSLHLSARSVVGDSVDLSTLPPEDVDFLAAQSFERYFHQGGLFGSVEHAAEVAARIGEIGVDEIACLIDFGVQTKDVLASLEHLGRLRSLVASRD